MSSMFVLDASALIALIFEEPGFDKVEQALEQSIISSVNLAEVATTIILKGAPAQQAPDALEILQLSVIDFNREQAMIAASFVTHTKPYGLSLGDRACIALGKSKKATILTADKNWGKIKIPGLKIEVIR